MLVGAMGLVQQGRQLARFLSHQAGDELHVCIVGSGPAGMYTTTRLLKILGQQVRVTILDRLPTPFGLVRSGVAPDHPEVKVVTKQFTTYAEDPRVNFFGNVSVGACPSLAQLRSMYHAVVVAYGCEQDRRLHIPGEDCGGCFPAKQFVWWYNGHPDARDLRVDLASVRSVAICGIGNVALDCARILLKTATELRTTDMAEHALRHLQQHNRVAKVHLIARRGPAHLACTIKEFRELVNLPNVSTYLHPSQIKLSVQEQSIIDKNRAKRRLYKLMMSEISRPPSRQTQTELHIHLYRQPVEVQCSTSNHVTGIVLEKTEISGADGEQQHAKGTGETEFLPAQLLLTSIGTTGVPISGLPFNTLKGFVPNFGGRVRKSMECSTVDLGLYVCGWLKRGPTGIIGTNIVDADETAQLLTEDAQILLELRRDDRTRVSGASALECFLREHEVHYTTFDQWLAIDKKELTMGLGISRPRLKITSVEEMLTIQACNIP